MLTANSTPADTARLLDKTQDMSFGRENLRFLENKNFVFARLEKTWPLTNSKTNRKKGTIL